MASQASASPSGGRMRISNYSGLTLVRLARTCRRRCRSIASRRAAVVYGGKILKAGIEDDKQNFTRFFLISRKKVIAPGANKSSIAFRLKNIPGSLFHALSVFASRNISLSKIESRPIRGRPWEYVFYVDFLRGDDAPARAALRELKKIADLVKVLGIYRAAGQ